MLADTATDLCPRPLSQDDATALIGVLPCCKDTSSATSSTAMWLPACVVESGWMVETRSWKQRSTTSISAYGMHSRSTTSFERRADASSSII